MLVEGEEPGPPVQRKRLVTPDSESDEESPAGNLEMQKLQERAKIQLSFHEPSFRLDDPRRPNTTSGRDSRNSVRSGRDSINWDDARSDATDMSDLFAKSVALKGSERHLYVLTRKSVSGGTQKCAYKERGHPFPTTNDLFENKVPNPKHFTRSPEQELKAALMSKRRFEDDMAAEDRDWANMTCIRADIRRRLAERQNNRIELERRIKTPYQRKRPHSEAGWLDAKRLYIRPQSKPNGAFRRDPFERPQETDNMVTEYRYGDDPNIIFENSRPSTHGGSNRVRSRSSMSMRDSTRLSEQNSLERMGRNDVRARAAKNFRVGARNVSLERSFEASPLSNGNSDAPRWTSDNMEDELVEYLDEKQDPKKWTVVKSTALREYDPALGDPIKHFQKSMKEATHGPGSYGRPGASNMSDSTFHVPSDGYPMIPYSNLLTFQGDYHHSCLVHDAFANMPTIQNPYSKDFETAVKLEKQAKQVKEPPPSLIALMEERRREEIEESLNQINNFGKDRVVVRKKPVSKKKINHNEKHVKVIEPKKYKKTQEDVILYGRPFAKSFKDLQDEMSAEVKAPCEVDAKDTIPAHIVAARKARREARAAAAAAAAAEKDTKKRGIARGSDSGSASRPVTAKTAATALTGKSQE